MSVKPTSRPVQVQAFALKLGAAELDCLTILTRSSRGEPVSAAVVRSLRREIARPDDRLPALKPRFGDHAGLSARDLRIIEDLVFAQTRILPSRVSGAAEDRNPVRRAAPKLQLQRMLDDVASCPAAKPRRPKSEALITPNAAVA